MNKFNLKENEEVRSELIRLYLDQEHPAILAQLQEEVRRVTNHIVRGRRDVKDACIAYARRHNLVDDPPAFPVQPSSPTPENDKEKNEVKEDWDQFYAAEKSAKKQYAKWLDSVFKAVKGIPELGWRKDKYQTLRNIYGQLGAAVLFRDTVKRVNKTKRAKPKKDYDHIPLEFGNSPLVETGQFYGNRRGIPFYNALVKVPGIKKPFLGRLRRPLPGRPIQGVTLTKKADGWYASVKCVVTKRQLPEPTLPAIGVDVGQTDLVALSDGYTEHNPRDAEFIAEKAAIQEAGDRSSNANFQQACRGKVARMDQNRKRRITHWINSTLLPKLSQYSHVFVEKLAKGFKSDKGPLSCMHVILDAIKQRLGDLTDKGKLGPKSRVREVECAYTSQTCSQCGNDTEIVRKGKYFSCLASDCMATLDADVNAARNILAKGLQLLAYEA
jgi:transposase